MALSDTTAGLLQVGLLVALLAAVHVPLGDGIARALTSSRHLALERAVYRVLRVEDAVSDVSAAAMRTSLLVFTVLFGLLLVVNWWLLLRQALRGPGAVALGRTPDETRPLSPTF